MKRGSGPDEPKRAFEDQKATSRETVVYEIWSYLEQNRKDAEIPFAFVGQHHDENEQEIEAALGMNAPVVLLHPK